MLKHSQLLLVQASIQGSFNRSEQLGAQTREEQRGGRCPGTLLRSLAGCPVAAPMLKLGCWGLHPHGRGFEAEDPSTDHAAHCSQRGRAGAGGAAGADAAGLPCRGGAGGMLAGSLAPQRLRQEELRQQLRGREEALGVCPAQAAGGECAGTAGVSTVGLCSTAP